MEKSIQEIVLGKTGYQGYEITKFPTSLQEKILTLVKEDEKELEEKEKDFYKKTIEYFKSKGYSDEEITLKKRYHINLFTEEDNNVIYYDVYLIVETPHASKETFVYDRQVKLTSSDFSKERNSSGYEIKQKALEIIEKERKEILIKELKEENEKLKEENETLKNIIKKLKSNEELTEEENEIIDSLESEDC
jgi:hypothetical protein